MTRKTKIILGVVLTLAVIAGVYFFWWKPKKAAEAEKLAGSTSTPAPSAGAPATAQTVTGMAG